MHGPDCWRKRSLTREGGRGNELGQLALHWEALRSGRSSVRCGSSPTRPNCAQRNRSDYLVPPCKRGSKTHFTDAKHSERIRKVIVASPFRGKGHRRIWARLRIDGVRTSKRRVLHQMGEAELLTPERQASPGAKKMHSARSRPTRPNTMWGIAEHFGNFRAQVSAGLKLRHNAAPSSGLLTGKVTVAVPLPLAPGTAQSSRRPPRPLHARVASRVYRSLRLRVGSDDTLPSDPPPDYSLYFARSCFQGFENATRERRYRAKTRRDSTGRRLGKDVK